MSRTSIYRQRWYAEDYDRDRFGRSFGGFLETSEVETFLDLLSGHSESVLDVGAGTGKLTLPLARSFRRVVSADFSAQMLRVAIRKGARESRPLTPAVCDAHRLCFGDRSFESVVCSRMLMHLEDWRLGIAELCRVARSVVVLDFPPATGFAWADARLKGVAKRAFPSVRPYRTFRCSEVSEELLRNRFCIEETRRGFFLPIALHRRLDTVGLSLKLEGVFERLGLVYRLGAPVFVKAVRLGS